MKDLENITVGSPPLDERRALMERLLEYSRQVTGLTDVEDELYSFTRDDRGEMVAGIYGWFFGGTCEIALLWVREERRGQGLGGALMDAAEDKARALGCHQMVLRTHSFQAPDFYKHRGYEVVGAIDDYPLGHRDYLLRKTL